MKMSPSKVAQIAVTTNWLATVIFLTASSQAQDTNQTMAAANPLKRLSLEDLMNLEVTTAAREPEPWFDTPAAIQVITQEDIRRSGASSLPEALRLAPNLEVAQVNSSSWAINARGFNNTLANKLLVMIDGRTVYTPLYAGVFWDVQNPFLEDIDRIEVISGPGGTLWGANAVNGIINVITKTAKDTQGTLVTAGGGTQLQDFGAARYGGQLGQDLYFRIYGEYFNRDSTELPNRAEATNDWLLGQGGFRMDWLPPGGDTLTLQGDGYGGSIDQAAPGDTSVNGQNVLGRWTHPLAAGSDLSVQMYWDRTHRRIPNIFAETLNTYDLDFQHRLPWGQRQSLLWGAGYRLMADAVANTPSLAFLPPNRNLQLFSAFFQDEITLLPKTLRVTLGSKLEHNDFSGFEVEPSIRLAWTPDSWQMFWAAVSRAERSPSRIDTDFYTPGAPPYNIIGSPQESESLMAYELGYRVQPTTGLTLSASAYYNDYDHIRSLEPVPGSTNMFEIGNGLRGQSWGVELSGAYQVTDFWRLRAGYTFLHEHIYLAPGSRDLNHGTGEGDDPQNQASLQSQLDLPWNLQLDVDARYVDTLPSPSVPSYFTFDVRLAWHPRRNLELAIVGQNLWDASHAEFGAAASRQEVPRSVYGKVTWHF